MEKKKIINEKFMFEGEIFGLGKSFGWKRSKY